MTPFPLFVPLDCTPFRSANSLESLICQFRDKKALNALLTTSLIHRRRIGRPF